MLPRAPRAHKPEGGDPELSPRTVTRQQAAPLQGTLASPSGCRHSQPRSLVDLPWGLWVHSQRWDPLCWLGPPPAGAQGSPAEPSQLRELGKYKGERGRGGGRRPGPPDSSSPPLLPPWPGCGRNKRPLDPCLLPRNRGRRTSQPPHPIPQRWGGRYLVARGSAVLSTPSSWFESSVRFPPGGSPHTTGREQPKPKAEKTPNSSRPG